MLIEMYQKTLDFERDDSRSCQWHVAEILLTKCAPGDLLRFEVPEQYILPAEFTRKLRAKFREKGIIANTATHDRMVTVLFSGLLRWRHEHVL